MKFTKQFCALILTTSVLTACNQTEQNSSPVSNKNEIQTQVKNIKKHEAVNLPVDVFVNKNYEIEGQKVTYSRSITDVAIRNFDEGTEIEFLDLHGSTIREQGFDLQNDYKLLEITMKQETKEEARSKPYDTLILENSSLVIGDIELGNQNDFIMYQQNVLGTDYKVGRTFDETGRLLMAIPNEYANEPNLQLRVIQELDGEKKYIYIDLN